MPKKKADDDVTQPLIIKSRHIMSEGKPPAKPDTDTDPDAANVQTPKPDLTIPREDNPAKGADDKSSTSVESAAPDPATHVGAPQTEEAHEPTAETSHKDTATEGSTAVKPESEAVAAGDENSNQTENQSADAAASQPSESSSSDEGDKGNPLPNVKKAVADEVQTQQREHELESYIEDKKFFVPIDTIAQKKSVKVSIGLTILVVFLGVVLVDLMLDSGVILLVQKIPHTHFFSIKPPSE